MNSVNLVFLSRLLKAKRTSGYEERLETECGWWKQTPLSGTRRLCSVFTTRGPFPPVVASAPVPPARPSRCRPSSRHLSPSLSSTGRPPDTGPIVPASCSACLPCRRVAGSVSCSLSRPMLSSSLSEQIQTKRSTIFPKPAKSSKPTSQYARATSLSCAE